MYEMTAKINKKFFEAKKDSLGAVMESSVNCYTCHNGKSHPEISLRANRPRPAGQGGPGGQQRGPGGNGGPGTPGGVNGGPGTTTPPADKKS